MSRLLRSPSASFFLPSTGLALLALLLLGFAAPAPAQDTISGRYVNQADKRASLKLLLAPSEKDGMPVSRVWGVVTFKDPGSRTDTCTFEFQSTVKSDIITCRDAMNPGCRIVLHLVEGGALLDAAPECLAVYCKGAGHLPPGLYARVPNKQKKHRRR